tara:strand:+ start:205 stop:480 length:276 start_codon:yes stop_codon:yes gene_type:complete
MKKIIISVGIFLVLGFTYNQNKYPVPTESVFRYEYEILSNLDEWIKEDINNGRMEEGVGEIYLESIGELRKSLIEHEVSLTCERTYYEYTD